MTWCSNNYTRVAYSQYPSLAIGPRAIMENMSNKREKAPPWSTPLVVVHVRIRTSNLRVACSSVLVSTGRSSLRLTIQVCVPLSDGETEDSTPFGPGVYQSHFIHTIIIVKFLKACAHNNQRDPIMSSDDVDFAPLGRFPVPARPACDTDRL